MSRVPMLQVADEVKAVASVLIAKYHPHLSDASILYIFSDQQRKKIDRTIQASISIMNPVMRFLSSHMESVESGYELLMMIDIASWSILDDVQQRRLVDSQLEYVKVFVKAGFDWIVLPEGEKKENYPESRYGLTSADIIETTAILERHGWPTGEREERFKQVAMRQLPMQEMKVVVSAN